MSLPPELRALCFQLSSTPPAGLPRLVPTLLRHVLRCHLPLSGPAGNTAKADASASSVLVHKLKTQLSTLLSGKSPEGRFTAVVLIKAVVEVGGWEVLHGSESWVRGLLSVLGKPDSAATKQLCIITLTKIYSMTHQYQTLVREITTPTLPTFVTSCLNLISSKSPVKALAGPSSLQDTIFQSFAILIPRHTTIYRPFISQLRLVTGPNLAPTSSDELYVSSSVKRSARRLAVVIHQTAAKNGGGEEWGKAVRNLIYEIHSTADQVFRAVIEDWESTAGYVGEPIDVNQPLHGVQKNADDLPPWTGVDAGIERLTGLLEILAEYFRGETSTPVAIPLGSIMDMVTRLLSIAIPSSESAAGKGAARLHPAIDRDERDGLWSGLPQIYVAAVQLIHTIAERLEEAFLSIAQASFDQICWVFPFGRQCPEFRLVTYNLAAKVLRHVGPSFDRVQTGKCSAIIRACCHDLESVDHSINSVGNLDGTGKKSQSHAKSNNNADTFLRNTVSVSEGLTLPDDELTVTAQGLLPLVLSHLPQQYLDISIRSLVERVAILRENQNAMLASILNPFVGKNGKAMTSILPHLTRAFGNDDIVEILLRPRMPLLPSSAAGFAANDAINEASEDEHMDFHPEPTSMKDDQLSQPTPFHQDNDATTAHPGLSPVTETPLTATYTEKTSFGTYDAAIPVPSFQGSSHNPSRPVVSHAQQHEEVEPDIDMSRDEDSDDESVHLTMQLDTDSESGEED